MKNIKGFLIFTIIILLKSEIDFITSKIILNHKRKYISVNLNNIKQIPIKNAKSKETNIPLSKCFLCSDNSITRVIHVISTRFLFDFKYPQDFCKKKFQKKYILNGIRVMKKYLFPSLENQTCKQFIWILLLGDRANKTLIESLLNFNYTFEYKIIYSKSLKDLLRNMTKGSDILITTNIDYDDIIYYDAVNDVRKAINIKKPMVLYGYTRGAYYFEKDNKYYERYYTYRNQGAINIFCSLIIVLNKVNDTYTIYDLGGHTQIRSNLLKMYRSFGIKNLSYEPAIFDSGDPKFVYVRQRFSHSYNYTRKKTKGAKIFNFNLSNLFGN